MHCIQANMALATAFADLLAVVLMLWFIVAGFVLYISCSRSHPAGVHRMVAGVHRMVAAFAC
jgi:hypothetical protein